MRWLLWCFCLLAESYETTNHWHWHWLARFVSGRLWFLAGSHQDLKNWNLLQSGQSARHNDCNLRRSLVVLPLAFPSEQLRRSACGREMGDLFNTLNKSLPRRSSKALKGQLLCCYCVCSARNCVMQELSAGVLVSSPFWSSRTRRRGQCVMFLNICRQIHSVVLALSRQINRQKVCENS